MKNRYRLSVVFAFVLSLFFVGSTSIVNAQQLTAQAPAQVTKKDHNREPVVGKIQTSPVRLPRRITNQQVEQLQRGLSRSSDAVIKGIKAGVIPPQPTECFGIPLTDYAVCIDIWIEDSSPGPG